MDKIEFQLDKRITLKTVKEWIQFVADKEKVRVVYLKPDEGDGGYNYASCGDNEVWIAPFKLGKAGDRFGKYELKRDCDNPVECMLISFFHELSHLKFLYHVPHSIYGFRWNDTSDYQYELWISMIGIDYALTEYGIRFSDQAVKWLLNEGASYIEEDPRFAGSGGLTVKDPNTRSYEVSGVQLGAFGQDVPIGTLVSLEKLLVEMRTKANEIGQWDGVEAAVLLQGYANQIEQILLRSDRSPAAMTKALFEVRDWAAAISAEEDQPFAEAILNETKKGLETPARNCDRPFKTLTEFQRYYIEHGRKKGLGTITDGEVKKAPWKSEFEKWMLEPQ